MADITQERVLTAEEYFAEYPETMQHMELIEGRVIVMPAPHDSHQKLSVKLTVKLASIVEAGDLGEVRHAPTDVVFEAHIVLQPDLFFVAKENTRCTVDNGHWYGAPDLIIEILSPSTAQRDRDLKFELYEKHGVREYWILDTYNQTIEVYALKDEQFQKIQTYSAGNSLTSTVLPNLTINVSELFPSSTASG